MSRSKRRRSIAIQHLSNASVAVPHRAAAAQPSVYVVDSVVAAIDGNAVQFETNSCAQRTLQMDLRAVDIRLQTWAPWARPHYGQLGYPTRAVTERVNEGGILAKDVTPAHAPEWPEEIVEVDQHVSRLPTRHMAAVMANYFHLALVLEYRAAIYVRVVRYLVRTRPQQRRRGLVHCGPDAFRLDLDRARWTLKALLRL
jgi:hypothetical protein